MLKRAILIGLLIGSLFCLPQTALAIGEQAILTQTVAAGGVTWTLIQDVAGTCNNTLGTCAYALASVGAGDLLVFSSSYGNATPVAISSISTGGSFVADTATDKCASTSSDCLSQGHVLSATGGVTAITQTMASGSLVYITGEVDEYKRSTGTATLDDAESNQPASCTSCATVALTLTGTDVVVRGFNTSSTPTAPGAPWTNPNNLTAIGFIGALNQTSGTGPTIAQTPSSGPVSDGLAFK